MIFSLQHFISFPTNGSNCICFPFKWPLCICVHCTMFIREILRYSDSFISFFLYAGALSDDGQPLATTVLMVIGVAITGHWRIPLAYCLTDGTNAELQQSLLLSVISKLWECQCLAISVTMDGLSANQKMLQNLGCCLDPEKLVSVFPHPLCPDIQVAVIFDACHMMKLVRNCLREYQTITIPGTGNVKWQHIQYLHEKQVSEGLRLGNSCQLLI